MQEANKIYHQISNIIMDKKEITEEAKLWVIRQFFLATLLYDTENLTLLKKHTSRLQPVKWDF